MELSKKIKLVCAVIFLALSVFLLVYVLSISSGDKEPEVVSKAETVITDETYAKTVEIVEPTVKDW